MNDLRILEQILSFNADYEIYTINFLISLFAVKGMTQITNEYGLGVKIIGVQPICFSALPYTAEDLDPGLTKKNQHPSDLSEKNLFHCILIWDKEVRVVIIVGELTRMNNIY